MMETVLETTQLCKNYRRFRALDGVTMRVPKGAIYGLVGRNGAGKTTLIRVICGLQEPSTGGYSLYGRHWGERGLSRVRRRMGAVVETPSFYGDFSAMDNLKMQARVLGLPKEDSLPACSSLSDWKERETKRREIFRSECGRGSALPLRCAAILIFSCLTSRQTVWIRRGSWRCASCF